MHKKLLVIALGVALPGVLIAGVWYVVSKPASQDMDTSYDTSSDNPTEEVAPNTISYPHDDPDSPYIDLDAKLHVAKYVTLDPEIITINYELKDVALCGSTYKTKQIFIDGVDVVQRLAQLLDADAQKNDWYCEMLIARTRVRTKDIGGTLSSGEEIHIILGRNGEHYYFAPHLGISIDKSRPGDSEPTWEGGYPIYVLLEENKIQGHIGVYFGTLR